MKENPEKTLRVGRIHYINALPFYHRLNDNHNQQVEYYESYPAKVNLALRKKKIHLGPVSSLEYLNHQKQYLVLPNLAIGSRDFSGSVLLLSREKIEGLDGEAIALSRESLSSSILLKILLKFKYKFKNRFVEAGPDAHQTLEKHKAVLVIGDSALLFRSREFLFKYDLSDLWWNWTERPFCFALWAVQKKFAKENPECISDFLVGLNRTLQKNLSDIEGLIKETLNMSFLDPDFSKIFGYLFNLIYGFDDAMEEGLQLYFRLAHRLGVSPKPQKIKLFGSRISI